MITADLEAPFIGRVQELSALNQALSALDDGRGRVITLSGEPGIGKTRLLAEMAARAEAQGKQVLWSQMIEDPGAPPYFPWRAVLRTCVQLNSSPDLFERLGPCVEDLANILPELRTTMGSSLAESSLDSSAARYQLYDTVTRFLLGSAEQQPLVILLDNLHLADQSSLSLLKYFCQHLTLQPLLLVAAYRDSNFHRNKGLRPVINVLSRTSGFLKLEMTGLALTEVAELLRRYLANSPPASMLESVYRQSDGNPLFVTEVGRILARNGQHNGCGLHFSVPESLREVIAARLDSLPEESLRLLRIAAIQGREFDLHCLADLCGHRVRAVGQLLQPAESAGVIESTGPDRFRFHHALFREVLYAEHTTVSRVLLHRKAAEHLEKRYKENQQAFLSQIAHHFFEAAQTGREDKAIHFCHEAAKSAINRNAYSEAARLLENALQVSELGESERPETRFDLLMTLGHSQYRAGHLNSSTTTLMKAAILAYRQRWWARLADALFLFQHVCQQSGLRHVASIPLHRAVLEKIPASSVALRARVLASLARAYRVDGDPFKAARTFHESVALARELDDPDVLLACLNKGAWTIGRVPQGTREGLEVSLEALKLGRQRGTPEAVLDSLTDIVFQLCDLGEVAEAEKRLEELKALALKARHAHFLIILAGFEISIAILRGQWASASRLAGDALRMISLTGVFGLEGRFAFQMFAIHAQQGRLRDQADNLAQITSNRNGSHLWLPGQVLLHCELGQHGPAREALDRLGDVRSLPHDDLYPLTLVYLADACARLGDTARCCQLLELLAPYRGFNVTLAGTLILGAASGYLALLAVATRRDRLARPLFEEALELNASMQALPLLARVQTDYAHYLSGSERTEDRLRARQLLEQAEPVAERLGLRPVIARIATLKRDAGNSRLTRREVEILELVAEGSSNLNIADRLHISHSTVATHIRNIFRKIGASNRTEAAEQARRSGLIQ